MTFCSVRDVFFPHLLALGVWFLATFLRYPRLAQWIFERALWCGCFWL